MRRVAVPTRTLAEEGVAHYDLHVTAAGGTRDFPRGVALLVAAALFMEILDGTIIVTALPAIARDLAVDPLDANLAVAAYLIAVAVVIPVSGWLAERFTVRRIFLIAIAVFLVASLVCALSTSLPMLVAARVLQGLGGALMVPVGRLAVLRAVDRSQLVAAIAWLTWPALVAPVLAPLLGGLIATYASWQWIFLINVPLALIGLAVAWRVMPREDAPAEHRPIDGWGIVTVVIAVAAGMVGLDAIRVGSVHWLVLLPAVALCVVVTAIAARHLRSTTYPLVNTAVLRIATFRSVTVYGSCYRAVITAVPFLLPLMFQLRFDWSAVKAGALVSALFLGNVIVKPTTTPLMRAVGIKRLLVVVLLASIVVLVAIAVISPGTPIWVIAVLLCVSGALRSIGFTAYNTLAFADVDDAQLTDANTIHACAQELFAGIGVACAVVATAAGAVLIEYGWIPFAASDFGGAFILLAVLMALTVYGAVRLPPGAGAHVTGAARS